MRQRLIMVINADPLFALSVASLPLSEAYKVVAVRQGDDALTMLLSGVMPDGIVMDLGTPIINGWRFHATLRRDQVWRSIPVLVMTELAHASPTLRREFPDVTFLPKASSPDALLEEVRRLSNASAVE